MFKVEHRVHPNQPGYLMTRVEFNSICEGPPGHVHGGASAGLLDEVLGVCVWNENYMSVTQNLTLHYGRALPLDQTAYVLSHIRKVSDTTVTVECTIYDDAKTPYVTAQGTFHRLTLEQLEIFKSKLNLA